MEYIKSSLQAVSDIYDGSQLIILRSTVAVGTTRGVVLPFLARACGRPETEVLAAMCPERTIEGNAIEELFNLPQIIGGNNEKSAVTAKDLFSRIAPAIVSVDSPEEAELAKLYSNTYRDMHFALGNVLCMAAQQFGADGSKIIQAANEGYARSRIALPGFVAGPCLEKDAYILTSNMPDCPSREFILNARMFNESLEDAVVDWVEKKIGAGSREKVVALSGMAFKGVPATSDLRGSSSVYIAQKLVQKGYSLRLHDYVAFPHELEALGLGCVCAAPEEACEGSELLLILNNHKEYSGLEPFPILRQPGFSTLDAWNVCRLLHDGNIEISTLGTIGVTT
jgi:UDP-N-acetyl-D-mannosaminuronic acid dehydrogenase